MILHKILKYLAILLSVIAAVFFVYTIASGDDAIEIDEEGIQGSTIVPLMYLTYVMLGLILAAVIIFLFVNLASNPKALKKTAISVGIFLVVIGIACFALSDGSDAANNAIELDEGEYLSESGSKWIDTSIYTFYILSIAAVLSIVWSGVSKTLNR